MTDATNSQHRRDTHAGHMGMHAATDDAGSQSIQPPGCCCLAAARQREAPQVQVPGWPPLSVLLINWLLMGNATRLFQHHHPGSQHTHACLPP